MNYPQLVSNLTQDQGLGLAVIGESIADSGMEFCQYYAPATRVWLQCEKAYANGCSLDGNLWGSNDMGSPLFCTNHAFPQEQLGHEFVELNLVNGLIPA